MNTQTQGTTGKISISEIKEVAEGYSEIRERIRKAIATINPVELVTPKNLTEEKEKWINWAKAGFFDYPQFHYDKGKLKDTVKKSVELNELKFDLLGIKRNSAAESFVFNLLYTAVSDAIVSVKLADAILRHDDEAARIAVLRKYGRTEEANLWFAHENAEEIQRRGEMSLPSSDQMVFAEEDFKLLNEAELRSGEIKRMFEWAMNEYGTKFKWPVEIIEDCSAIDVRDKSAFGHPIIAVPLDRKVSGFKMAELIGHEIECHWRNSINAELIGALKGDDELVYEGLAKTKDNRFNRIYLGKDEYPVPYYILTQEMAMRGMGFAETARDIYKMLPTSIKNREAKAWLYTYRTFRGVSDTRNPQCYAFTKDRAYFEGIIYANELKMRGLEDYLSFGTLRKGQLEDLISLTEPSDIKKSVLADKQIQQKAIEKMIKCLRGYGTTEVMVVKDSSTALAEVKTGATIPLGTKPEAMISSEVKPGITIISDQVGSKETVYA